MRPAVVGKTLAIVLVLQRGNDPRWFGFLAFGLVLRRLPSSYARHKGESCAVRRPHRVRHAVVELREPHGFATIGWHYVQLRVPLCLTLREKGQARAIGRPAGGGIAFG